MMEEKDRTDRCRVLVLMGGPSNEREISLLSGSAVAEALQKAGHTVNRADITPTDVSALDREDVDVIFIALHGDFGESGHLQELCEQRGLRYTGSPPRASQLGMDKAASKQIFLRAGLNTPDWMIIEQFHDPQVVSEWLGELPPPCVVKPVNGGSSLDVTLARDARSRDRAIDELLDRYSRAMVERYVCGREMTVGIVDRTPLDVLEVIPRRDFYDYEAKYSDEAGTQYLFPDDLDDALKRRLCEDALTAHRSLGCRDLSRVDFILDDNNVPQVLEINTIPGFTRHSLVPKAAANAGIDFIQLCDRLVQLALSRTLCMS